MLLPFVSAYCNPIDKAQSQSPQSTRQTNALRAIRFVISQVFYLNIYESHKPPTFLTGCIFFLMILLTSDNVVVGSLSPGSAYLYIEIVIWVSLFIGIWALFVFFRMTVTHQTLNHHRYKAKVIVYKLVLLFTNIEGSTFFVIHSQLRHGEANCN